MVHVHSKVLAQVAKASVDVGKGLHGDTTIQLGDHQVTADNWVYILISILIVAVIGGLVGFGIYKYKTKEPAEKEGSEKNEEGQ